MNHHSHSQKDTFLKCIVCSKQVRPGEGHLKVQHDEGRYVACCVSCVEKFQKEPLLYKVD